MKKRLMCLVLCLFTVLPLVLTGCRKGGFNNGSTKVNTITMYMAVEEGTTEKGIAVLEDAINEITENKYYTHVVLKCYPTSEYAKVIDEKMAAAKQEILDKEAEAKAAKERAKELKKAGITTEAATTVEETTGEIETVLDKNGHVRPKYPEPTENQVDLFLIPNQAKYLEYATPGEDEDTGLLYDMTAKVGDTFKLLNKYINPAFLDAVRVEGAIYGIPSNHMVSEYTYLLLNKEACTEQLNWTGTEFTTLSSLLDYCKAVQTYCPDYVPLYNLPDPDVINVTNEFSILGNIYVEGATFADSKLPPKSLFANGNFTSHLKTCYKFKEAGYVEEGDKYALPEGDKKYAAAFLKGSVDVYDKYGEEYYIVPFSKPTATASDLFSGVWAISSFSKSSDVAMRIISMMSLDADFRNLIQYGVEGETYYIDDETEMIVPYTEGEVVWKVNPLTTGNQFLLKQNALMSDYEMKISANDWEVAKAHNQNLNLSLYGSFALKYITEATIEQRNKALEEAGKLVDENGDPIEPEPYGFMYTQDVLDGILELTKDVMDRVNNFEPYVDENGNEITFDKYINLLKTEVGSNIYMVEATNEKNPDSIASQYLEWFEALYPSDN